MSRLPLSNDDNNIVMLVHRMSKFAGGQTQIQSITTQPHGELVILYEGLQNRLLVVQVLAIFKYFELYRFQFKHQQQYSLQINVPEVLRIEPCETNEGINQILVSQKQLDNQSIILVYISSIEVITINVRSYEIVQRKLYTVPFEIIYADTIGNKLYVSMFNITMAVIQLGKQSLWETKNRALKKIAVTAEDFITHVTPQSKFIQFKQIKRFIEQTQLQPKLWQTICGFLMYGDEVIGSEFNQNLNMSNSLDQYNYRQNTQFFPIKYQFSACRHYLVGSQYAKTTAASIEGRYNIRAKLGSWGEILETKFKPEINPYWTYYQVFRRETNKDIAGKRLQMSENKPVSDCVLIAYYKRQEQKIVVSKIEVNYEHRKRMTDLHVDKETGDEIIQTKTKFKSQQRVLVYLKNVKRRVSDIKWIGLNQLLYIQEGEYLYFVEFDFSYLEKDIC